MSSKTVDLDKIGTVTFQKRKGSKSLRIRITPEGDIKVSLPSWVPYVSAIAFAKSKEEWIFNNRPKQELLNNDSKVGKAHRIYFIKSVMSKRPTSRINGNSVNIHLPINIESSDPKSQSCARLAVIRVLKQEAQVLLPQRIESLALKHGFTYRSLVIKRLSSRWGSCDSQKNITLNCYLMQLPWKYIDYVIMHELVHTKIMAHGEVFWSELSHYVTNLAEVRKTMKTYRPNHLI